MFIPLGIILPIFETRKLYFNSDVALFVQIFVYAMPISFGALWGTSLFLNVHHVWRWCASIRIEPKILKMVANKVVYISGSCLLLPLPLLIYGLCLLATWETKNQNATEAYVVVVTVLCFICLFFCVWGMVSLQWLGLVEKTNGIESLVPIISCFCCASVGTWGSTIMSDWITQSNPQILNRVDEDDYVLLEFIKYTCVFLTCLTLCAYIIYTRIRDSADYLKRFGRHPEDWEKGVHGEPQLLVKDLPDQQQVLIDTLDQKIRYRERNIQTRESKWLNQTAIPNVDDEYKNEIESHVIHQYISRKNRKENIIMKMEADKLQALEIAEKKKSKKK